MIKELEYALIDNIPGYPAAPPFSPSESYPEYPFDALERNETNYVYKAVRQALLGLNLDRAHYGTAKWNPLGNLLKPGGKIVIKPNLVRDFHESNGNIFSILTHASVIRAVADFALIALKGKGSLVIADAPHCDAGPFERLLSITGLDKIQEFYLHQGHKINIHDLRTERAEVRERGGVILNRIPLSGDPAGYVKINLGDKSRFTEVEDRSNLLCGSDYDFEETRQHHQCGRHEYFISKSILSSDLIISIPKLKTHKRTGITLNLKNMIGANGDKNYIPHYRTGSPIKGGDEFPYRGALREAEGKLKSLILPKLFGAKGMRLQLARAVRRIHKSLVDATGFAKVRSGAWHGNDTLWRAILDINKVILFGDSEGRIHSGYQRKYLSMIDGVIAGEGEGPLNAAEKKSGLIIAGFNPFVTDAVGASVMGFHPDEISEVREGLKKDMEFPLKEEERAGLLKRIKEQVRNQEFKRWQGWENQSLKKRPQSTGESNYQCRPLKKTQSALRHARGEGKNN